MKKFLLDRILLPVIVLACFCDKPPVAPSDPSPAGIWVCSKASSLGSLGLSIGIYANGTYGVVSVLVAGNLTITTDEETGTWTQRSNAVTLHCEHYRSLDSTGTLVDMECGTPTTMTINGNTATTLDGQFTLTRK